MSRDPLGLDKKLFKSDNCGEDLKMCFCMLIKTVKNGSILPVFMQYASIHTKELLNKGFGPKRALFMLKRALFRVKSVFCAEKELFLN